MHDIEPVRLRLHPSGKVIEIRSNQLPDGGFVTTYTDVTETVAAEEESKRANETLEQRVRERTEELTRLNDALSRAKAEADEANISKTRFLAAASHDILQPLNAARLYATSLVERDREAGDASLAENIDASLDAVEEILTALLDISRLDTGAMKPQWSSFRIEEIFRQLQREFEPVARERGAASSPSSPRSLTVRSDRRLLRRLLQNLVSNAIKYTPSGRVLVGARRRGGRLVLEVWDTGLGIPASKQKVVFREFQRLDQGAKVARGLGLGLSIVERIGRVLDHPVTLTLGAGPRLGVPGRGAGRRGAPAPSCRIERAAGRRDAARGPARARDRQRARDPRGHADASLRLGLRGDAGAAHLREALDAIRAPGIVPEVIVADYHLDEGDGLDVIRTLRWKMKGRHAGGAPHGRPHPAVRDAAAALDVHLLNKPVKPAALRALLAQWRASRVAAE